MIPQLHTTCQKKRKDNFVPKILRHRRVHDHDKKQRQKHKTRMSAALPPLSKNTKLSSGCKNTGVFFFGDWQLGDFLKKNSENENKHTHNLCFF